MNLGGRLGQPAGVVAIQMAKQKIGVPGRQVLRRGLLRPSQIAAATARANMELLKPAVMTVTIATVPLPFASMEYVPEVV